LQLRDFIASLRLRLHPVKLVMDKLDGDILRQILEIIAWQVAEDCKDIDFQTGRMKFGKAISEYARLARVSQRFKYFMEKRVRVDGKLLKTTLLDMSVSNFNFLFATGPNARLLWPEVEIPHRDQVLANCGAIWKSPRLGRHLETFFWCYGAIRGLSVSTCNEGGLFYRLIYWIPITLMHTLQKTREAAEPLEVEERISKPYWLTEPTTVGEYTWYINRSELDEEGQFVKSNVLKFGVGPYRTESFKTGCLWEGRSYQWTGVSLTHYKVEADTPMWRKFKGRELQWDAQFEHGPYWLWFFSLPRYCFRRHFLVDYVEKKILYWEPKDAVYSVHSLS
jgi:hypothetical protein